MNYEYKLLEKLDNMTILMDAMAKAVIAKLHEKPKKSKWNIWTPTASSKRPSNLTDNTVIKVLFRDGSKESGYAVGWCWNASGYTTRDIVAYKVLNK